jgi:hypothetical protein
MRRTDNIMSKRQKYQEDRQYNDQKTKITGGQDNTMIKRQKYQTIIYKTLHR